MIKKRTGEYLHYIDSWRFIAVALVILSHMFHFPKNGFLGVDIFFVISGYVITRNLTKEKLSITEFYKRRLIRILPPLLTMLIALIALSRLFFSETTGLFRGEINSILGFFYNIKLIIMDSSYNGIGSSASSPLFHLWSISVEEQFYIIWPLLFIMLSKISKIKYKNGKFSFNSFTVAFILLLIFVSIIYSFTNLTTGSYFNPFARAFELLLGCLLFFVKPLNTLAKINESSKVIGARYFLLTALITVILFAPNSTYLNIKVATLLTVLIVFFIFTIEGSSNPMRWQLKSASLGRRSYGAYLFHLPFVVISNQLQFGLLYKILSLIFLIFLVELSFRTVEKTTKQIFTDFSFRKVLFYSVVGVGAVFSFNQIMPAAVDDKNVDCVKFSIFCTEKYGISNSAEGWICPESKGSPINSCYVYKKSESDPVIMIIGDSVAKSFTPGIAVYGEKHSFSTYNQTINGCPWEIYGNEELIIDGNPDCGAIAKSLENIFDKVKPKYIILTQSVLNGTYDIEYMRKSIDFFSKYTKNIILLSPPPYIRDKDCDLNVLNASHCNKIDKNFLKKHTRNLYATYSKASELFSVSYQNVFPLGCGNFEDYSCPENPKNNLLRSANVHLTFFSSFQLQEYYQKFILK